MVRRDGQFNQQVAYRLGYMPDDGENRCHLSAAFGHATSKAGKATRVLNSERVMAIVSNTPMLEVPGWLDNAMLPKEPIVVSALKITALGVEVFIIVWVSSI